MHRNQPAGESQMPDAQISARLERMESDISDLRADVKALLAAHNMGKGFWFTAKVGAAIIAGSAAAATVWHYIFGQTP